MEKVAVIGFGFMGKTHAFNILKNKDLQLVAIVDKDADKIDKDLINDGNFSTNSIDQEILKTINKYSCLDECLLHEELDAVHICVHTNLHYEMAKKALLAGKHVFIEKPFTLDINQAEEILELARKQNKILMVAHVVRFMPPYKKLKHFIDNKEFGKLKFLSFSRFSGIPAWGQWKEKRLDFGSSGGALFDLAIHDIDFANYILGTPDKITCNYLPGLLSQHDYINALWEYSGNDIRVKIESGNIFHSNFPFQAGYMAQFEKASLFYTSLKGDVIQIATDTSLEKIPAGDTNEGFVNEIDYFAHCIKNNTHPNECMPESSLQTVRLCYNHLININ